MAKLREEDHLDPYAFDTLNMLRVITQEHPTADGYQAFEFKDCGDPHFFLGALSELAGKNLIEVRGCIWLKVIRPDYHEYLASPEWAIKRQAARERVGFRCQICNDDKTTLDTHHRTYERLGNELPEDLIVLCRDCHGLFHKNGKLAR